MEVSPASDFLFDEVVPGRSVACVEVLLFNGKVLRLRRPEIKHRSHHIKRVSNAQDHFVGSERDFFAKWVMGLDEPALIVDFAFSAEATVLQAVVESVVQVTV